MLKKTVKEPLLQFVLIGVLIFGLTGVFNTSEDQGQTSIHLSSAEIERLSLLWQRQKLRPATEAELQGIIDAHIREEIFYREALAMGLDKDDTIVRRRMAQKYKFVTESLLKIKDPDEETLTLFYQENAERYRKPDRMSFTHVYFNSTHRGAVEAESNAKQALQTLNSSKPVSAEAFSAIGDTLSLDATYQNVTASDVGRVFGRPFSNSLQQLPAGTWQGPVKSGFGIHLVKIDERIEGQQPLISEVRDKLLRDYRQKMRKETDEALFERIKKRYQITIAEKTNSRKTSAENVPWVGKSQQTTAVKQ